MGMKKNRRPRERRRQVGGCGKKGEGRGGGSNGVEVRVGRRGRIVGRGELLNKTPKGIHEHQKKRNQGNGGLGSPCKEKPKRMTQTNTKERRGPVEGPMGEFPGYWGGLTLGGDSKIHFWRKNVQLAKGGSVRKQRRSKGGHK